MAKKSRNQNSIDSNNGELSLDQLDSVAGGAGQLVTDNNNAQMMTDLHLTQPNALQPHNSTNPGIQTDILTGTDLTATTTHDSTSFTAVAGARAGVANDTQLAIGNLHSQAGVDVDTSFKAGLTGISGQAGGHAIASTSLDMGAGFTNNNTVRADGDVFLRAGIGASAGIEGGVRASTNITQSNNVDVGADTHVFNSTVYEAGGKAEAGAQAKLSPLDGNLTVGANAFAGGYVSLGETVGVDSHGVTATAGGSVITPGSVGVGFAPLIGEQDGKYNVGIHVALAAGIGGVTLDGNISLDKDMVNNAVVGAAHTVADTAVNVYHDPAVQFVGGLAAQAGQQIGSDIAHGATNTAHTALDGTVGVGNTIAHGTVGAANTVADGTVGAANTVAHGVTDAANTVAHGVTGAANTVGSGIADAAHATGAGIVGAANTVGAGVTGAANTVAHGVTGAANTVGSGITDAAHATGAAITGGATTAANTVAQGATDAAHAAATAATNAAHAAADAAKAQADAIAHAAADAKAAAEHAAAEAAAQAKAAAEKAAAEVAAQAKAAAEHAAAEAKAAAEKAASEAAKHAAEVAAAAKAAAEKAAAEIAAAKAAAEKHAAEVAAAAKAAAEKAAAEAKAAAEKHAAEVKAAAEKAAAEAAKHAAEVKAAAERAAAAARAEAERHAAEVKAAAERAAAEARARAEQAAAAARHQAEVAAAQARAAAEAAARHAADIARQAANAVRNFFCHTAGTLIAMADGTYKPVEQLKMGDETLLGGQVLGRGEVLATDLYSYRGTVLNGRHAVFENGHWVRVENSAHATLLDVPPTTVYPVVTANHLLVCEQYICADLAEMDNDIGAVGRLAALNEDTARNAELLRAEERYGLSQQRAA